MNTDSSTHVSDSPNGTSAIAQAARLLEVFLLETHLSADRSAVRRVVREAADGYDGAPPDVWWRWMGEAAKNLGLKCKIVDGSADELFELGLHGARMVLYGTAHDPWFAVVGHRGRKLRIARTGARGVSRWIGRREWRKLAAGPHPTARCVVIEQSAACDGAGGSADREMSPFARLLALLRPERSDILVLVVFALVVGLLSLATPIAVDSLVTTVAFGRMTQPLVILALLLFGFLAFSAALRALKSYVVEIIQCRLFARIGADLAYRLPRVRSEIAAHTYLPEMVNRFFDTVTVQKATAGLLLDGLQLTLNAVVGLAVLAFYHPWLLGFDIVLLATIAFTLFVLGRGAIASSIRESKAKYKVADWLEELVRCPLTFKSDGGPELALERGDRLIHDYLVGRRAHFRILMRQVIFTLGIQAVASAVLLGLGGWLVMMGQMTLGQLVAAELIVTVVVGAAAKLGKSMEGFYDLMAAVDKLGSLFDLPIEEQEGVLQRFPDSPASVTLHEIDCVAADGASRLEQATGEIRAGERLALIGRSQESSLLLDLMFGLRTPVHGHLAIDGIDTRDIRPDFLRQRVALVRGIEIFHGTVAENVHLARPDVTSDAVRDALEMVGLLADVSRFGEGLGTQVISGGSPLSEDQVRRLMLARAIAGRPGLLLIDGLLDSFSDFDAEELLRMLADRKQPWTLVVATRRLGSIAMFDRAVEVESGGLTQWNTIEELGDPA